MIAAIESAATEDPSLFFISDAQEDPKRAELYLDRLIVRVVNGILLISRELADEKKMPRSKPIPMPFRLYWLWISLAFLVL